MVIKKLRLSAAALVFTMLMTSVAPATAMAAPDQNNGKTLVVTKEHLDKNGNFILENGSFDNIVFDRELDAKNIQLKNVNVGAIQIESGTEATFEIFGGTANEVQISKPDVEKPTLRDKAKLLLEGMTKKDADVAYQQQKQDYKAVEQKAPNFVLKGDATIKEIQATGNANLSL